MKICVLDIGMLGTNTNTGRLYAKYGTTHIRCGNGNSVYIDQKSAIFKSADFIVNTTASATLLKLGNTICVEFGPRPISPTSANTLTINGEAPTWQNYNDKNGNEVRLINISGRNAITMAASGKIIADTLEGWLNVYVDDVTVLKINTDRPGEFIIKKRPGDHINHAYKPYSASRK